MPNLVGIGNSQVPTNAMLGGLAYQNSNNVSIQKGELGNIAEIRAKLNITPIDYNHYGIFVYDTKQDSDGGAWRHRTSHTSWYNEAPSRYRGHRKEFPSIAVIVSDTDQVSIYDGDDPNLSLWMTFQAFSGGGGMAPNYVLQYSGSAYRVAMLNGLLVMGQGSGGDNWGNPIVNFISEEIVRADPNSTEGGRWAGNIASRNGYNGAAAEGYVDRGSGFSIPNSQIRGVAMRVMSDAITDKKTGLPIPTIALCHSGGVSVITAKDENRSVYDVTASAGSSYNPSVFIDITETGCIIFEQDGTNGRSIFHIPIPTADRTSDTNDGTINDKVILKPYANQTSNQYPRFNEPQGTNQGIMKGVAMRGNNQALLSYAGLLTLLEPNFYTPANGRTAYITTISNTGWMWGGNRGAFLCDTDPTAINTTNLVTNGSFGSNISGWTSSGTATMSHQSSSQVLRITGDSGAGSWTGGTIMQDLGSNFVVGKTYSVSYKVRSGGNSGNYSQGFGARIQKNANFHSSQTEFSRTTTSDPGSSFITIRWTFTATLTRYGLQLFNYYGVAGHYLEYDDIVVKEAINDWSGNWYDKNITTLGSGQGLIIETGTAPTKEPVYPGAELQCYSNFANSTIVMDNQSYHNFGTDDYYMSIWAFGGGDGQTMMIKERPDTDAHGAILLFTDSGKFRFYSRSNGTASWTAFTGNAEYGNHWSQTMVVRRGNTIEGWVNGEYQGNTSFSGNSNGGSVAAGISIGKRYHNGSQVFTGKLAMAKIGRGSPSSSDIKKMYDDERKLFAPNAKCSLYGTSEVVESIAYDKSTDILHAITNQGRSDFVGLNRINNTTTNSDRAISAAGGLVAED